MVCMVNTLTLYKVKTLVNLESAMPAVDQPVGEVDRREVGLMLLFHFTK